MRTVYVLLLISVGYCSAQFCFTDTLNMCSGANDNSVNCNATYSGVHLVMTDLHEYVMHHLSHSFQYLFMSATFANYEKHREGFAKLYRKYSDSTWEDAIDLIKYIGKRGDSMNFDVNPPDEPNERFAQNFNYNMHELESLSRALDMHKHLAIKAHTIHSEVTKRKHDYHDAETLSYLEEKFVHKHADRIRELAGYANDVSNMVKTSDDPSLSIFLFDEYLQKHAL
ncbi:hypothetical protein O3M35_006444 [Rhynocoris fuscipes]|uniref:Ferritin n=1 Tax=Rhynocoris fuscipes TaxID=488301 RepID=A0AAW1DEY0_9HEMI